jgi:D-sedoheptulose 7-phosphate isomerase
MNNYTNKKNFIKNYFNTIKKIADNIDMKKLNFVINFLSKKIKKKNNIFVAGNGGSAAVANHLLCDFNKGIKISSRGRMIPKIISLSNSIEIITAISNDISYDKIFTFQLENYYKKGDCLICFSSSGQSKNIIDVINFASKKKIQTILFQGFGKLNKKIRPDYYINLNYKNYGVTEDIFQSLMHIISQNIRSNYIKKKEIL